MNLLTKIKQIFKPVNPTDTIENKAKYEESNSLRNPMFSIFDQFLPILENPDEVLRLSPGRIDTKYPLLVYHKMELSDARIAKCLNDRRQAVLSIPFDIYCDGESRQERKIKEFVRWWIFEQLYNLEQSLENILDAFGKGFSVSEMIPTQVNYKGQPKIIISELKHREPWQFKFDKDLNLRQLTTHSIMEGELRSKEKHLIFSYKGRYCNPYGESLLGEKIFWLYLFKRGGLEFWIKFLDRLGIPPQKVTYPRTASEKQQQAMKKAMESLFSNGGILLPEGWIHELVELGGRSNSTGGGDLFNRLIDWCDKEITINLLTQTLTTETSDTGSYAMAEVQRKQLQKVVKPDAKMLALCLNNQMIKPIVDLNYGIQEFYPYLKFEDLEDKGLKELSETYKNLFDMGVRFPKIHIHETFAVPQPKKDEEVYSKDEVMEEEKEVETQVQEPDLKVVSNESDQTKNEEDLPKEFKEMIDTLDYSDIEKEERNNNARRNRFR